MHVPLHPGAAFIVRIVATAHQRKMLPSEVYQEYLTHKNDYHLLWAFEKEKARLEKEEIDKHSGKESSKAPRGLGR